MDRFWSKVAIGGPDDCWNWTASTNGRGYGKFCIGGRLIAASRFVMLERGPRPRGACVLHRCDNPTCVNPAHLFVGTHRDNTADMLAKGRGGMQKRTHCPQGHELADGNLCPSNLRAGRRICLTCKRESSRRTGKRLYWKNRLSA